MVIGDHLLGFMSMEMVAIDGMIIRMIIYGPFLEVHQVAKIALMVNDY